MSFGDKFLLNFSILSRFTTEFCDRLQLYRRISAPRLSSGSKTLNRVPVCVFTVINLIIVEGAA